MDQLGPIQPGEQVTHGACPECVARELEKVAGIPAAIRREPAIERARPSADRFAPVGEALAWIGFVLIWLGVAAWLSKGAW